MLTIRSFLSLCSLVFVFSFMRAEKHMGSDVQKNVASSENRPSYAVPQTQNNPIRSYIPVVSSHTVIEDPGAIRWQHTPGTLQIITYQWGDQLALNPSNLWRIAFTLSVADWNFVAQKINYSAELHGAALFDTYTDTSFGAPAGYTDWLPYNGYLMGVIIKANTICDFYSDDEKRGLTGHELGHGLGLGHITNPPPAVALMGNNPNQMYFQPQLLDIELVNLIYP